MYRHDVIMLYMYNIGYIIDLSSKIFTAVDLPAIRLTCNLQ